MLKKMALSLFPVLLGGVLSIVGGYYSNIHIQNNITMLEQHRLTQERIEALYLHIKHIEAWRVKSMIQITTFGETKGEFEPGDCPMDRASIIVDLYFPSLREDFGKLYDDVEEFKHKQTAWFLIAIERNEIPTINELKPVSESYDQLGIRIEYILDKIQELIPQDIQNRNQ